MRLQTRENCRLKLLRRANDSLKIRLARINGERKRHARHILHRSKFQLRQSDQVEKPSPRPRWPSTSEGDDVRAEIDVYFPLAAPPVGAGNVTAILVTVPWPANKDLFV